MKRGLPQVSVLWTCLLLFCGTVFLNGCSNQHKFLPGDGFPKKFPDIHKINNPEPKVEPISRYGNPPVYAIGKKSYKVMSSSRGYRKRGYASWYGTKFHGRRTSSGEPYDMFAMTAAHPTLPLPTYAKVTNLENGRSIIVKFNDRGPFHANRLIDLSYTAAAKLGILGRGTGYVEVVSIDPRDHPEFRSKPKSAVPLKPTLVADRRPIQKPK